MDPFTYRDGQLAAEDLPLSELATRFGTPLYVTSYGALLANYRALRSAFAPADPLVAYSVKANPTLAVIQALAREGAGADVVSRGEMERALRAGVPPERIVFAGVGKRPDELAAALEEGIACINVEVADELENLARIAQAHGVEAPVALRVNPDVVAETHEYIQTGRRINKFGIPFREAAELFRRAAELKGIALRGIACHIGSQILDTAPFAAAFARLGELVTELRAEGIELRHLDAGGGLGVRYGDEQPPSLEDYARVVREGAEAMGLGLVLEPGRVLTANAGLLLMRVLYRKTSAGKRFVVVDAAMNDLMRPALYGARHAIRAVRADTPSVAADVVGPICETGDFFLQDAPVPDARAGELLAAMSAGAYGRSMASNYNTRCRAAEVLVRGGDAFLVHERETVDDLLRLERIPAFLRTDPA